MIVCERERGVCERESDSVCERESDSVCERESDGVCERESDGVCVSEVMTTGHELCCCGIARHCVPPNRCDSLRASGALSKRLHDFVRRRTRARFLVTRNDLQEVRKCSYVSRWFCARP